jgi:hypothetical protein
VLRRIVEGDPLGLRKQVFEELSRSAYFVNPDRVLHRALARVAYDARQYRGSPELASWLSARVRKAVDELLEEQQTEEFRVIPVETSPDAPFYVEFATRTQSSPAAARFACAILNRQSPHSRKVFHMLVLAKATPEDCAVAGLGAPAEVTDTLRRTMLQLGVAFEQRRVQDGPEGSAHEP